MSEDPLSRDQADSALARRLVQLTEAFYAQEAQSFSSTRKAAWEGWRKIFSLLAAAACEYAAHEHRAHEDAGEFQTFLAEIHMNSSLFSP